MKAPFDIEKAAQAAHASPELSARQKRLLPV